jgi:hypothetical protein
MVLLEFAMNPPDRGDGLSTYVARILDVIDRSGVPYQLTPMGTIPRAGAGLPADRHEPEDGLPGRATVTPAEQD